jgi:hypothetical protein
MLLSTGFALNGMKRNRIYDKKIDGDFEAHLVALSCSEPPNGFARWSLRLLADKVVELNYIDSISHETVRRVLKKTKLFTNVRLIHDILLYAWTNPQNS